MKHTKLSFPGAAGHQLAAWLNAPDQAPRAYALFAHCFTCGKDLKGVSRISRALVEKGIAVLRFDFTGLGESEGDFADTNFSTNLDDLRATVDYMRAELEAPQLLVGHSLGGAAALTMAREVAEVRAVATLGAPADTQHLRETLMQSAPELADQESVEVRLAGRPFRIRRQLIDDLGEQQVLHAVRELGKALLVMHSPVDAVVGIDHARRIYQAARHPKSFISLDDADHLLLARAADADYAAEVLAAWASRYLDSPMPEPAAASPEELPEGTVRVVGGAGLAQEITVGSHRLKADEPARVGGTETGPTPYDLLLAGLGACTSMTLRMYANRKGWPLEGVDVRLTHRRIHAKDCAECATESGRVDLIERQLGIEGDLDEAQLARLFEIADRCPVHRTLTSETVIETQPLNRKA